MTLRHALALRFAFALGVLALLLVAPGCASDDDTLVTADGDTTVVVGADLPTVPAGSPAAAPDDPLAALQGWWQSTDDPAVRVQFDGDRFRESYDGTQMLDGPVRIVDACPTATASDGVTYFQVGEEDCYSIVDVTASALSYSPVGGRGNTLSFRRASGPATAAAEGPQGEGRDPGALFGVAVCEALRPAVLTGRTAGLERYAAPEVLATLAEDAAAGHRPDPADIVAGPGDGDATCTLSAGGDAWFELTLMGDGHVGQNAVSVARRTSYD